MLTNTRMPISRKSMFERASTQNNEANPAVQCTMLSSSLGFPNGFLFHLIVEVCCKRSNSAVLAAARQAAVRTHPSAFIIGTD